jgi:hypothetical protein
MRGRDRSSAVACLIAALLAVSQGASGAPARHRKAKRGAPAAAREAVVREDPAASPRDRPAVLPDPGADASTGQADPARRSVEEAAGEKAAEKAREETREEAREEARDDLTLAPVVANPPPGRRSEKITPVSSSAEATVEDHAALGRREAARLAAGRIEVAVSASLDVGRRHFTFSDPIGARPRPYLLEAAPLVTFGLEAYPLASSDLPIVRDLGFRGRFSRAFALDSSTTDGVPLDTSWTRFGGEIRQRVLLPGAYPLELGVVAGVDASYFGLTARSSVGALVPAARTVALRFGADGRVQVARRLSVLLGGAYLSTTSRGEIYDHFRGPRVGGVDGQIGCAFALTPGLEARLDARYTRYFASFDPQVGDAAVAGGALDEQFQIGAGLRYAH